MTGLEYVLEYVLQRIGDLHKVYLVGSLSKGQSTEIIDLVLVGDNLNKVFLIEQIEKAEKKLKKKIRFVHYSNKEFDLNKIKEPGMHPLLLWSK
jgi:predicted nucleotidyltransferase